MKFCWVSLNGLRQHCKPRCDALLSHHDCQSPVLAMREEVGPRDVVSSLWLCGVFLQNDQAGDGTIFVIRLNFHEPLVEPFTGLSEDSWLLGPFVMRTNGTWSRSGSHSLSRVKKYRLSCFPISVSCCCCCYYYVRSQVLPVELGCGDAERARLARNTGSRRVMILSPGNEFTLTTDRNPFCSQPWWGTRLPET